MAEESLISPQRKAEQLLYMADAVQRSIKSRRNIVSDIKKQREALVDDFENSLQMDTSDLSLSTQETPSIATTHEPAAEAETRPKMPNKGKSEKKSKTKTIAELRQQLQDCESALVEIKENASLKYLKLQMAYEEMKETSIRLKELKAQADEENRTLRRKLASAVGADRVEWIAELESNQTKLQMELDQIKAERDAVKKEVEDFKKICCPSCLDKMKPTPQVPPALRSRSLWSLFQLDEEARATETEVTSTVATVCGSASSTAARQSHPRKISFETKVETNTVTNYVEPEYEEPSRVSINDDLEADLEAIEQKMKNDIDAMSREWKRPSKKRVHNHTVRRDLARNKRNSLAKTKSSARDTLDSFFSQSIRDLGNEEIDEEQSFYSIQKFVSSLPGKDADRKKRQGGGRFAHSSTTSTSPNPGSANSSPDSQGSKTRVFGQDVDAVEVQEVDDLANMEENPESVSSAPAPGDRRGLMSKAFSFSDSFRGLSKEVENEAVSSKAFERRLENLRAKSLRGDFSSLNRKTPPKSTLRSSTSVTDHKAVHWEDPSKKEDLARAKVHKEVEAWAAVDLAPITALSV